MKNMMLFRAFTFVVSSQSVLWYYPCAVDIGRLFLFLASTICITIKYNIFSLTANPDIRRNLLAEFGQADEAGHDETGRFVAS